MKIPTKLKLHEIAFNLSLDIDFKDLINLYKTCTAKSFYFLVIDTTFESNNPSRFRENLLERIYLIITIGD